MCLKGSGAWPRWAMCRSISILLRKISPTIDCKQPTKHDLSASPNARPATIDVLLV